MRWEPQDFVELGTRIMVVARLTGAGRTSGASIDEAIVHVWTIDDGRAVELRVFSKRSKGLRALGSPADQ